MSTTETKIEWADATWNPVRGCSRVSEGCRNCYAERMAARFAGDGGPFAGFAKAGKGGPRWTGRVEIVESALRWPLSRRRWAERFAEQHGRRPRVFVNSMSDLFHEALIDADIAAVFGVMASCPEIDFLVLTKRPELMREWFNWCEDRLDSNGEPASWYPFAIEAGRYGVGCNEPLRQAVASPPRRDPASRCDRWPLPNVWLGVSVEDQATADERVPLLLQTPAAKRFVSYEPALGAASFSRWMLRHAVAENGDCAPWCRACGPEAPRPSINWLIVGGESGPGSRPCDVEWIRSAVRQCQSAGVPVFVKQLGAAPVEEGCAPGHVFIGRNPAYLSRIKHRKGGDMSEWPEDLRVREVPQ